MQWYEELFNNFAESYDKQVFVQGTVSEVDFIEKEINFNKSFNILDIGCGTGRHSIELAKRGYSVTGIDLSDSQLARAKQKAEEAKVKVEFIKRDARDFDFNSQFNLAIMICEGAFSLMETDEMNFAILQNAYKSLKENGKFIFTTLNGLFPLFHSVKNFINSNAVNGESKENTFDLMTFRDHSVFETDDDSGNKKILHCNERYYVPSEITWLLKSIGFKNILMLGCDTGVFNRNRKLTTEDYEMLVICEK
jgi:2-polyprenyl-3-methyl-5-hydroxy-6-metoxy-1,4-benzoquinol methylase